MRWSCLVLIVGLVPGVRSGFGQTPDVVEHTDTPENRRASQERVELLRSAMSERAAIGKCIDATLQDVLEALCDHWDVTMIVDTRAFKRQFGLDVSSARIRLPPSRDVSCHEYLESVLRQVGARYEICRDYIKIQPCTSWMMRAVRRSPLPTSIPRGTTHLGGGLLNPN